MNILLTVLCWIGGVIASIVFILWAAYKLLVVDLDHPRIVRMRDTKGIARHYYCAVMQTFYMGRGKWYPHPWDEVIKVDENSERNKSQTKYKITEYLRPHPSERLSIVDCYMVHRNLRLYREVTKFSGHHTQVPPCFMFSYFTKACLGAGASLFARARCIGGYHTRQEVTVHQDLRPLLTGRFSISTQCTEYRNTTRGIEGDVSQFVYDEHDILVWEGKSRGITLNTNYTPTKTPAKNTDAFEVYKEEPVISHMDTGYKYGKASLDWQPQHLSRWMAKLAGFKSSVAHGMWTAAMAVEVVTKNESCFQQTYPMHIELVFRSPMELGTKALMRYDRPKGSNSMTQLLMVDSVTERPILQGRMYVGPKEKLAQ